MKTDELMIDTKDADAFSKKMAELMMSLYHDASRPGKSKAQLEQQVFFNVKASLEEVQGLLSQGLNICQNQLPEYEFKRIFQSILSDVSVEKSPQIDNPDSALIDEDDYDTILTLTYALEEKQFLKEAQSLYIVLMTFSPHDYRSYINYGIVIQEVHDKYTSAQFFEAITEIMCNPFLDYYAAKSLIGVDNKPKASSLIHRAIETIEQVEESSAEKDKIRAGLIEFKTQYQL
ncbi:hypothetical protein [Photobacterium leiognathi]|uniref:hypothetical protein n=1 Tax=Photobacterium leiognathi TaxID=553611 RepID=UPI00298227FD|nr:hypothetical protein [Photobacterium leiognathi]